MSEPQPSAFWQLLQRLMTESGLSQRAVADAIGVSKQTIQDWRNKRHVEPQRANIMALAKLFKVPADDIFEALDASKREGMLFPKPLWRMIVADYLKSPLGRDTPGEIADKLYRAQHAEFARRLVHAIRSELEAKRARVPKR